jgi:hypothetical protein
MPSSMITGQPKKHFGPPPSEKMICEWRRRERIIIVKEE